MYKRQKIILWIGIIIIVLMGLFPPYEYEGRFGKQFSFRFLFCPDRFSELDLMRLIIQWIIVSILAVGAIYSTKGSKNVSSEKDT